MNAKTAKAAAAMVAVVIVNILAANGIAADTDVIATVAFYAIMLVATVAGCWFNFNFTEAAQKAQEYLNDLKAKADEVEIGGSE